ncbi:unnamed protein product, partial [Effrenium voratum]
PRTRSLLIPGRGGARQRTLRAAPSLRQDKKGGQAHARILLSVRGRNSLLRHHPGRRGPGPREPGPCGRRKLRRRMWLRTADLVLERPTPGLEWRVPVEAPRRLR